MVLRADIKIKVLYFSALLIIALGFLRLGYDSETSFVTKDSPDPTTTNTGARALVVSCVGDSITQRGCVSSDDMTYVAQLDRILGSGYNVSNYGVSGRTMLRQLFLLEYASVPDGRGISTRYRYHHVGYQ
jgi:hypothetical protein